MTRREFVATGAIAVTPQVVVRGVKPVVIAAGNGNRSKDQEGLTCVAKAFKMITAGSDVLDAVIAGVNIVELDPNDTSVGFGGLPNADPFRSDCSTRKANRISASIFTF